MAGSCFFGCMGALRSARDCGFGTEGAIFAGLADACCAAGLPGLGPAEGGGVVAATALRPEELSDFSCVDAVGTILASGAGNRRSRAMLVPGVVISGLGLGCGSNRQVTKSPATKTTSSAVVIQIKRQLVTVWPSTEAPGKD